MFTDDLPSELKVKFKGIEYTTDNWNYVNKQTGKIYKLFSTDDKVWNVS